MSRALDVMIAATALAGSAPLLGVAMVAIRLETPGPSIYRQARVGKDGRRFELLKRRTITLG